MDFSPDGTGGVALRVPLSALIGPDGGRMGPDGSPLMSWKAAKFTPITIGVGFGVPGASQVLPGGAQMDLPGALQPGASVERSPWRSWGAQRVPQGPPETPQGPPKTLQTGAAKDHQTWLHASAAERQHPRAPRDAPGGLRGPSEGDPDPPSPLQTLQESVMTSPNANDTMPKGKKRKGTPKLVAVTFNGNAWSTIKAYLLTTSANVVFAQEHRLLGDSLIEGRLWALRNGWSSYWSPGAASSSKGRSGGTVVLVRAYLQSWVPMDLTKQLGVFWPHRGNAVVVSAGGMGPVLCVSCYFYTSSCAKTKVVPANMRLLSALGTLIKQSALPVVVGADWNMTPNVLCSVPFIDEFQLAIKADLSALGTCVSKGGKSVSSIDFFVLSKVLNDVVFDCSICPITPPRPHRPLVLEFLSRPRNVQVCVLKEPASLPVDPPFGPVVPSSDWSQTLDEISTSLNKSNLGDGAGMFYSDVTPQAAGAIKEDLGSALKCWLGHAETDLIDIVGSSKASVSRGEAPRTMLVNLINTFKCPAEGHLLSSRATRWVQLRFIEFARAIENWQNSRGYPFIVTERNRLRSLCGATVAKGFVKSPMARFKFHDLMKQWHPPLKSLTLQVHDLLVHAGYRVPNNSICKGLIARATLYAATASAQTKDLESAELEASSQAWKDFVFMAGDSSAAIAHKYTKVPLGLGTTALLGSSVPRNCQLQEQVDLWAGYWQEGQDAPEPRFRDVPKLPPISVADVYGAARSFARSTCSRCGPPPPPHRPPASRRHSWAYRYF